MITALLALSLLFAPVLQDSAPPWHVSTPLPATGEVTFYAPNVMERTYNLRLRLAEVPYCDPPECIGYVATLRPGDLGRKVWLQVPGREAEGPFLVVDYAARRDFSNLVDRGLIAEVDYQTAQRWGMKKPFYDVVMLAQPTGSQQLPLPIANDAGHAVVKVLKHGATSSVPRIWVPLMIADTP